MTAPAMPSGAPPIGGDAARLWHSTGPLRNGDRTASAGPGASWPLALLCDALCLALQGIDDLIRDDVTTGNPGWSAVLDPDRCPPSALPWLGQFVGVTVDTSADVAAQRAQIRAESGWARGTPAAIVAAARRYLSGTQAVRLTERDYGDPYLLTVTVYGAQVAGQSYSDLGRLYRSYADLTANGGATYADFSASLDELMLALQAAVPAGININLQVSAGQLYSDLTSGPAGGSYSAASNRYPTYNAMTNAPPGT